MNPGFRISVSVSDRFGQFEREGFQIIKALVDHAECDFFANELTPRFEKQQRSARGRAGGLRNLLHDSAKISQFAKSEKLRSLLSEVIGNEAFPVRAIFFDKTPDANWLVPWHQDLAIPVAQHKETPGFTGWSMKDEVLHVHPPQQVLENMVTVRLHLDACGSNSGALRIIPGSHRCGKLGAVDVAAWTASSETVVCELSKGDVLLMRPLLLHASSPATNPVHRRVLHIEYATNELPNGLEWQEC